MWPAVGKLATITLAVLSFWGGFDQVQGHPGVGPRARRQAGQVYYVELLVLVDNAMYAKWYSRGGFSSGQTDTLVKEYVSLVIHQANARLSNLRERLSYSVQLQIQAFRLNVDLLSAISVSASGGRSAELALTSLRDYVVNQGLTAYDHVLLMTGYDLDDSYEGSSFVTGKAYVSAMCRTVTGDSVSVVEAPGGYQSSYTVAHELSHSIGSLHDGQNNSCSPSQRYIMTADDRAPRTDSNRGNPWRFSTCSAQEIDAYMRIVLQQNQVPNCLSTQPPPSPVPEFVSTASRIPGQVYGPDAQCQMLLGEDSRLCLGGNFGGVSGVCTAMYCLKPDRESCSRYFAGEGTSCGSRKWCQLGRCVESADAPVLQNEDCAFGDHIVSYNGLSCQAYISRNLYACYNQSINADCCQSCQDNRRNSQACPYGDRVTNCDSRACNYIFPDGTLYARACCQTCSYDEETQCIDTPGRDGSTCAALTTQGGVQRCYSPDVAYQCCDTCQKLRTGPTDCEYGDLDLTCSILDPNKCTDQQKIDCCQSCKVANQGASYRHAHFTDMSAILFFLWGLTYFLSIV